MKKILITGAKSYIGNSFENYINTNYSSEYHVDTVDMVDSSWRNKSFAGYDTVFHVAGIAHQKETKKNAPLYYKVNRDLAIDTAKKAKAEGVKQFIFLSSMSVYGMETGVITRETVPNPKSHYGKSKLQAEEGIMILKDDNFKVCILRPPMVYGAGCKGNFQSLIKLVRKSPIFPRIHNKRSMIYIDNLCGFVKILIDGNINGYFFPQNKHYTDTLHMATLIAGRLEKKVYYSMIAGLFVKFICLFMPIVKKAFGSLIYTSTDQFNYSYCIFDLHSSIINSVK